MAEYTTNYNLRKPGQEDFYNVEDFNSNADIVDGVLKGIKEDLNTHAANQTNPHKVTAAQVGASNPNLLINGDFQVWQRGTSFEQFADSFKYTADRWRAGTASDAKTHFIDRDTDGSLKLNPDGGYVGIMQKLEVTNKTLNGLLTLSVKIKSSNDTSANAAIRIYADDIRIGSKLIPLNAESWKVDFCTASLPDNFAGITVEIYTRLSSTVNVAWAKLELGSVATPFVPRSYAEELAACQRYYCKPIHGQYTEWAEARTEKVLRGNFLYPVTMRTVPTIKIYAQDGTEGHVTRYGGSNVAVTVQNVGVDGFNAFSVNNDFTIDSNGYIFSWTADAEIY